MASAGNFFETERKAFDLRTKSIASTAAASTYTARVGGASDNFIVDRVIRMDTSLGGTMTVTLPNGKYYGQRCLVILEVFSGNGAVTTPTGDEATSMTGAGGYSDMVWMGDTLGWVELNNEAT